MDIEDFDEDWDIANVDDELDDIITSSKPKPPKTNKKVKREYVSSVELREELLKHIFNKKINEDYVMDKKLALMCMKITDELFEKANFRGYHNGWKYEMKSKAYENLVKYVHQYDVEFVHRPDFFVNWIYRVHEQKLQKMFRDLSLDIEDFKKKLKDIKKKFVKKAKDPNKVVKDTYKKVTAKDLFDHLAENNYEFDIDSYKARMYSEYPDLEQQFEEHKLKNSFSYVTQMIYRSGQHVIKNEHKNKKENQSLDDAILYRTDDFDEDAIENDNRFVTFDDNKLDYGGFDF